MRLFGLCCLGTWVTVLHQNIGLAADVGDGVLVGDDEDLLERVTHVDLVEDLVHMNDAYAVDSSDLSVGG